MFSHFFIDRPIFSAVVSIVISIAGLVAMASLPIAQYPQVTPIQIQVSATYPGASADQVAQNVGSPIEVQINGADNMLYMSSTSSSTGYYTLTVYFSIDTDPELAQVDVQNRLSQAMPQLPQAVTLQGVTVEKKSQSFLMILALYSPENRYSADYIANYANLVVLNAITRIDGANQSSILGNPNYAMRLWLKPDRMAQLKVSTSDVANAVKQQNQQFPIGNLGQAPTPRPVTQTFPVISSGNLTEPSQFEDIIIRAANQDAAIVRVKDVGYADLGLQSYATRSRYKGKDATLIAIYQQPGANAIEVSKNIRKLLAEQSKSFPQGLEYEVALDTTLFIQSSIKEVIHTFFEAVVLVVLVVFIFLHSMRLTIIPTLAVPISILGALVGMLLFGFSINMLTLFGMILAIGLVVDDAIVVVENTERNMVQYGLTANAAAKRAMEEVSGPVIAIVLVLNAVFIPVAFLGGITGALYKQFAITIAISVVFSGIVALTLSPALAALLIKAKHGEKKGFFKWFDIAFERVANGYVSLVKLTMRYWVISLLAFAAIVGGSIYLFKTLPTAFVPSEDQGYIFTVVMLPDSASLDRVDATTKQAAADLSKDSAVSSVTEFSGYSLVDSQLRTNYGIIFTALKDYEERKLPSQRADAVIARSFKASANIKDGIVMPVNPPSVPGLGIVAGFQIWIEQQGEGTYTQLAEVVKNVMEKARTRPELAGLNTTINVNGQQLLAEVDREKSEVLGVAIQDVYNTMQVMYGSLYVNQFPKDSRLWQVILQAEPESRLTPDDLNRFYVKNREGNMIPLSALVNTRYVVGPALETRFNNYPAIAINGAPAPGVSSGAALAAMREVVQEVLPTGYGFDWAGEAAEEEASGSTSSIAFVFGLIFVFLILAAQYESWSLPVGVMLAVPTAMLGALVAIAMRGLDNDIYFQIGLLTLIGLAAKNAILIVEFAVDLHKKEGLSFFDAAAEAARLRLRPIIMTSFAFILGVLPLALASGASANSRHSIGTGVVGGTLLASVVGIFFIPLFYYLLETVSHKLFGGKQAAKSDDEQPAPGKEASLNGKEEH